MKTEKMKKVLIALDYDRSSQKVAEIGYALAQSMQAEVILMHVVADSTYYASLEYSPLTGYLGFSNTEVTNLFQNDGLKKATQHFLDKTKHHLGDEKIQTLVKEGVLSDSIIKTAKEEHAVVIVMGSHSRKWLENIVMGSVTETVLRHSAIPLFIVPTKKNN
jgi:nucleotide-binding universal stress UspA family protein